MTPYYADEWVTLYHGDCREILPELGLRADCIIADPPYGVTSLTWDRWPTGWLAAAAEVSDSMWCFGSLRMFMARAGEFADAGWKLSHDTVGEQEIDSTVWEKQRGAGMHPDRFCNVHELIGHFYRGKWGDIYKEPPREQVDYRSANPGVKSNKPTQFGSGTMAGHRWVDDGTRLVRSVIRVANLWRRGAIHPTQKPVGLLTPLIEYACPPGGLVVDVTSGSASTGIAARESGRPSVLIEGDPEMCAKAARRLAQSGTGESARVLAGRSTCHDLGQGALFGDAS
jgi:site-specific DNA-methyltransferase (adenine-specific)